MRNHKTLKVNSAAAKVKSLKDIIINSNSASIISLRKFKKQSLIFGAAAANYQPLPCI